MTTAALQFQMNKKKKKFLQAPIKTEALLEITDKMLMILKSHLSMLNVKKGLK